MGYHRAGAQAFIFGHRNVLQMPDQVSADAEHNILGNAGKLPGLNDVENDRNNAQDDADQQNNADVKNGNLPAYREQQVDGFNDNAGFMQ